MTPDEIRPELAAGAEDLRWELARARADRERAEAAQRRAEERLRLCLDQSWDAVVFLDDGAGVRFVSPAARTLLGIRGEALPGRDVLALLAADDRAVVAEALGRARRGPGIIGPFEFRVRAADGTWRLLEARARGLVPDGDGVVVVLTARDLGDRRTLEERFADTERTEAIGRLARSVAHDGHNVMRVIMGYSDLLLATLDADDPRRAQVESIRRASEWGAVLTGDLLRAARDPEIASTTTDLNVVVSTVAPMLRQLMGPGVELVTTLDPLLGRVGVAAGEIEQLVLNLVLHMRTALPQGGAVTVETANVPGGGVVRRSGEAGVGGSVMLAVSRSGDEGRDVAPLVEPWVDAHEGGDRVLGLADVHQIVKQRGGHIAVSSDSGGSTFRIYLPRLEDMIVTAEAIPEAPLPRGSETVLIVEDEKPVRELIRDILRLHGYTVLAAREGNEALTIATRHGGAIDIVITDVIMPGLSSRDLVARLAAMRPGIRTLYISGYTDELIGQHELRSVGSDFLQKPFTVDALARKIREVLDAR
ncbi:MAG: response regulator [Candidatus Rokubacteria bacterium]|nr:response regulator [Candidatus Rokubacteria bacterium]